MATASVSVEFQNLTLSECFDQGLASYESICESTEPAKESGTQVKSMLLNRFFNSQPTEMFYFCFSIK